MAASALVPRHAPGFRYDRVFSILHCQTPQLVRMTIMRDCSNALNYVSSQTTCDIGCLPARGSRAPKPVTLARRAPEMRILLSSRRTSPLVIDRALGALDERVCSASAGLQSTTEGRNEKRQCSKRRRAPSNGCGAGQLAFGVRMLSRTRAAPHARLLKLYWRVEKSNIKVYV